MGLVMCSVEKFPLVGTKLISRQVEGSRIDHAADTLHLVWVVRVGDERALQTVFPMDLAAQNQIREKKGNYFLK